MGPGTVLEDHLHLTFGAHGQPGEGHFIVVPLAEATSSSQCLCPPLSWGRQWDDTPQSRVALAGAV